jgi:hypothetical protein
VAPNPQLLCRQRTGKIIAKLLKVLYVPVTLKYLDNKIRNGIG